MINSVDVSYFMEDNISFTTGKDSEMLFCYWLGDVSLSFLNTVGSVLGADMWGMDVQLYYDDSMKFNGFVRSVEDNKGDETITLDCISLGNAICNTRIKDMSEDNREKGDDIRTVVLKAMKHISNSEYEIPDTLSAPDNIAVIDNIDFISYQSFQTVRRDIPEFRGWELLGLYQSSRDSERDLIFLVFKKDYREGRALVSKVRICNIDTSTLRVKEGYFEIDYKDGFVFSAGNTQIIRTGTVFLPELPFRSTEDSPRSYIRRNTAVTTDEWRGFFEEEIKRVVSDDEASVEIVSSLGAPGKMVATVKINDEEGLFAFFLDKADLFKYDFQDTTIGEVFRGLCILSDSILSIDVRGFVSIKDRSAERPKKYLNKDNLSEYVTRASRYFDRSVSAPSQFRFFDQVGYSVNEEVEAHYNKVINTPLTVTTAGYDIRDDFINVDDEVFVGDVSLGFVINKSVSQDSVTVEIEKRNA